MRLLRPLHYTPKQWVAFCNTFLLCMVTFMCGLVIYEISILDQRFISVLDSSTIAIDLLAVNLVTSPKMPFWKKITDGISVYSAFYEINGKEDNYIKIIGSLSEDEIHDEDLRCLIDYGDDGVVAIEFVNYKAVPDSTTIFVYCHTKRKEIPKRVSLISYANTIPKQWMHVFLIYSRMETDSKMAACVQPITKKVQVKQIANFIAFYEQIGVTHFNFYERNATEESIDLLHYMKESGHSIKILTWNKKITNEDIYGQWSEHIQDCLHRAMYKYRDVITVDMFDFLFLAENERLPDMLDNYRRTNKLTSNLRLNSANVCKIPDDKGDSASMGKVVYRGLSYLSENNYILTADFAAAAKLEDSFTTDFENESVEILPESYGIVHKYRKKCDENITLDDSLLKYNKVLKKSSVLEEFWQSTRGNVTK